MTLLCVSFSATISCADADTIQNWPIWKRDSILVILSLISVFAASLSPILAANTLTLSLHFERDFTGIALLTGFHLCGVGVAGVLFVASARVWGKRHLYLLGTVLIVVASAWGGASKSYKSFLWARIIQGVGVAPFEALVNASVGDLYFVHQRGIRMALSNLALFGSAFFTPIVVGKMTHTIGYVWTFYFVAIFAGVMLPLVFLFVPETTFRRSSHLNTDYYSLDDRQKPQFNDPSVNHTPVPGTGSSEHSQSKEEDVRLTQTGVAGVPRKTSFARSLLPFNGHKTDENFFKLLLRPFPLFFHPAIFWVRDLSVNSQE